MMPPHVAPRGDEALEGLGHRRDRSAAIRGEHGGGAARMMPRHLGGVDRRRRGFAAGAEIDRDRAQAGLLEALLDEGKLAAFGVEGAGDVGRTSGERRDRERRRRRRRGHIGRGGGGLHARAVRRRGRGPPRRRACDGIDVGRRRRKLGCLARPGAADLEHFDRTGPGGGGGRAGHQRRGQRLIGRNRLLVVGAAHAQQPLLKFLIGGELRGVELARDAAVDHDRDAARHVGGNAEVLLDQQ